MKSSGALLVLTALFVVERFKGEVIVTDLIGEVNFEGDVIFVLEPWLVLAYFITGYSSLIVTLSAF